MSADGQPPLLVAMLHLGREISKLSLFVTLKISSHDLGLITRIMFADLDGEDGLRKVPGPEVELPDPLLDGQRPQDQPRSHSATRGRGEVGVQGPLIVI